MSDQVPESAILAVVEDDEGVARLEASELRRHGYRVEVFASAAAALAATNPQRFDCWLVDQRLSPEQTGLQLVASLRARGLQAPVILVTGNEDPNVLLMALRAGVRDFVHKGDGFLELLVSRVDAVIASARAEMQLQLTQARAEMEAERRRELEAENLERRRAEDRTHAVLSRLRDLDRRKDEFLAMLGHELRNPLAPIAGAVEVLLEVPDDVDRVRWAAGVIGRQLDQMRRLVDDLLDVARIMNGRLTLRCAPLDLHQVVAQAIERATPLLQARGHEFSSHVAAVPMFVNGDLVRLVQAIANLLDNAAKYTPTGGRVELHLERTGSSAELRVVDNGVGMAPEIIETLFSLFVQGERSADRAEGGLGLGLALVRRLVSLHAGSVIAASDGPGHGSTFTIRLPLVAEGPATPPAAAVEAELGLQQVLVVDDNVDAAAATAMLLRLWGLRVTIAEDGEQALIALQRDDPDVVLLDIGLPRLDGYGVLKAARTLPGARRRLWVAVTGYGQAADRHLALASGFDAHLVKPVAAESLRRVLAKDRLTDGAQPGDQTGDQNPPSNQ